MQNPWTRFPATQCHEQRRRRQVCIAASLTLGVLAFSPRAALSQDAVRPARAVVQGQVFDSVAGRPLAGAAVQLAAVGSSSAPGTAATDTAGVYRFEGVSAGRYVLGFYHDALSALGLDAPMRTVDVRADTMVTADLAVPSSETIRALRCGESSPFAPGMVVGFVRDAESRGSVPGATAVVHWRAFALDSANYRVVDQRVAASIEPDGAVLACHLPVDVPLNLSVTAPGHRDVDGAVLTVPMSGIGRLEVLLADASLNTGAGIIRGKVMRESGKPVTSGRVLLKALDRAIPIVNGEFSTAGVPSGTWIAQAQVIGVEPQDVLVTASESEVATANITVSNGPQRLDAVTVVGKMDQNLRVLDDVLRRSRIGMGTTFLPGHQALRSATFVSDVMREARGFQWAGQSKIYGRVTGGGSRCRSVAVYVDDVRQPEGFAWLDHAVEVRNVLAIETWPDIRLAPMQYRAGTEATITNVPKPKDLAMLPEGRPCALVLVWTRRRF